MAHYYDKTVSTAQVNPQRILVLDPRESLQYPFNIGDWTKALFAVTISYVPNNGDDGTWLSVDASPVNLYTARDKLFFGFRKFNGTSFPEESPEYFLGHSTMAMNSYGNPALRMDTPFYNATWSYSASTMHHNTRFGVLHSNGVFEGENFSTDSSRRSFVNLDYGIDSTNNSNLTSNFANTLIYYLEVVNKGLPNQSIIVKTTMVKFDHTKLSATNYDLNTWLQSKDLTNDFGALDFQVSGVPYQLPDTLLLHLPFYDFKLRVHNFTAIKLA